MVYASPTRHIPERAQPLTGCRRNHQRQTPVGTTRPRRNGFLNHRFHPVMIRQEALRQRQQVEQSFFDSLHHLATCYGFSVPALAEEVYPNNMRLAYQYVAQQLKKRNIDVNLFIMQDKMHAACLSTAKFYSIGQLLYYIPVAPLHRLLNAGDHRAPLILSVFAYLSQTVQVSNFAEPDSFLHSCYWTIAEWLTEQAGEWEREGWKEQLTEIRKEKRYGKQLLKRMTSCCHLRQFKKRLQNFKAMTEADQRIKTIAEQFFNLMSSYPGSSIHHSVHYGLMNPAEEERMLPEHYLAFVWSNTGWMAEQVLEYVNNALCEYGAIDEPVALQCFGQPHVAEQHDLHFANSLFSLTDALIEYLNNLS